MAAKSDTQCSHWTGRLSPHLAHLAHLTHLGHLTHQPSASSHQLGVWLPGGLAGNLLRTKRTKSATTTNHSRRALPQFPRTKLPHIIISAEECPVICHPHWCATSSMPPTSSIPLVVCHPHWTHTGAESCTILQTRSCLLADDECSMSTAHQNVLSCQMLNECSFSLCSTMCKF